jgi:hypothetical protein
MASAGARTAALFRRWRAADPRLTLDAAILKLEKAPEGMTLVAFAEAKHRTAEGYRRAFAPWYEGEIMSVIVLVP